MHNLEHLLVIAAERVRKIGDAKFAEETPDSGVGQPHVRLMRHDGRPQRRRIAQRHE
jgi:hypothetical protein